jgi:hypothetical protein
MWTSGFSKHLNQAQQNDAGGEEVDGHGERDDRRYSVSSQVRDIEIVVDYPEAVA